jgi:hypothetical protein
MHIAEAVRALLGRETEVPARPRLHDMKDYVDRLFEALASHATAEVPLQAACQAAA